jgi:SSS family solute:Na+ symporter
MSICLLSQPSIVLVYMVLGGLTSAIYNEVLQFFLIVIGFLPRWSFIGLKEIGGWEGISRPTCR